jgi:uncharacterized protein YqeY
LLDLDFYTEEELEDINNYSPHTNTDNEIVNNNIETISEKSEETIITDTDTGKVMVIPNNVYIPLVEETNRVFAELSEVNAK